MHFKVNQILLGLMTSPGAFPVGSEHKFEVVLNFASNKTKVAHYTTLPQMTKLLVFEGIAPLIVRPRCERYSRYDDGKIDYI